MRLVFVSHCDLQANSGIHVASLARAMAQGHGVECSIFVPELSDSDDELVSSGISVSRYVDDWDKSHVLRQRPDLVYSFTPRRHVVEQAVQLAQIADCPYVIHLEDNEFEVSVDSSGGVPFDLLATLPNVTIDKVLPSWRMHPRWYRDIMQGASGITGLVDELREHAIGARRWYRFWPGADEAFFNSEDQDTARRHLSLPLDRVIVPYVGAVHESNYAEFLDLVFAIQLLRDRGHDVMMIKTGRDTFPWQSLANDQASLVLDWGFVSRDVARRLISASDVLVQPGRPNKFNAFRFPSKLPEYFASGLPVVLPEIAVGRHLENGTEALVLKSGSPSEIADAVEAILLDPALASRLSTHGAAFADRNFRWDRVAVGLVSWLSEVVADWTRRSSTGADVRPRAAVNSDTNQPRLIAFYLPQFHTISENDEWWGEGFTEWTNVNRATPLFPGHEQPRKPHEAIGQYDLSDSRVLHEQASLAERYGIDAFCFYVYWFGGRRLLERPVDALLASNQPRFPFLICWANENWTRRWDGLDEEVLIGQEYEPGWEDAWFEDFSPMFHDPRYLRLDDEPVVLVYSVERVPDLASVILRWKYLAVKQGLRGLHVVGVQHIGMPAEWPILAGCDASVEFPPHMAREDRSLLDPSTLTSMRPGFRGYVESYPAAARAFMSRGTTRGPWYRGVMPSWDNTPRRGDASHVYVGSSPELYGDWLKFAYDYAASATHSGPLVFINAWNEWAEGAVLEPDEVNGYAFLERTALVAKGYVPRLPDPTVVRSAQERHGSLLAQDETENR